MVHVTSVSPDFVAVTVTVPPASAAVTEIVGVVSEVTPSLDDAPESEAVASTGVFGVVGAVTSAGAPVVNVIVDVEERATVVFPARSVNAVLA
jgi:hypothetical protein